MKVRLLPLAISAAIAMPGVALAEGPTVYGKLNVSYEMVDVDYAYDDIEPNSADNWQLISNSSRFGVKGDAAINDSLKAIYQIEWGLDASDDNSADLTQRDRFVGLAGGFGTFQAGKFDSPLKKAQGKVDQFNDLAGDIQYVLVGENRLANILQYSTPDMSGFQGNIAFAPGEQYDDGDEEVRDGPADSFSLSGTFNSNGLYLAAAYDAEVAGNPYVGVSNTFGLLRSSSVMADLEDELELAFPGEDFNLNPLYFDTLRLVGQYTMDALQIGAMYQMAENSDSLSQEFDADLEQDGFVLSGAFTINSTVLKAQYTASTSEFSVEGENVGEVDATAIGLGIDQKLSKQTTAFVYYNMLSYEFDDEGAEEQTKDNLGVGIVHNF